MKTISEFFKPWITRLCAMILAAAVALGGYNWVCWSALSATDWAAWIQAFGSIAAILGAFAIANKQVLEQNWLARERELEVAARAATFGKLAAQRTLAAVDNFIVMLNRWDGHALFKYDDKFLSAAEDLIHMALQRDLPPEQANILVSLHNELVNVWQMAVSLQGYYTPLTIEGVPASSAALHHKVQLATIDAIQMEESALENLTRHRSRR